MHRLPGALVLATFYTIPRDIAVAHGVGSAISQLLEGTLGRSLTSVRFGHLPAPRSVVFEDERPVTALVHALAFAGHGKRSGLLIQPQSARRMCIAVFVHGWAP